MLTRLSDFHISNKLPWYSTNISSLTFPRFTRKVIANCGGVNPHACARELASVAEAAGIPLKAGVLRVFMRKQNLAVQELSIHDFAVKRHGGRCTVG